LRTGQHSEAKCGILALVIANIPVLQFTPQRKHAASPYIDQNFNAVEGNCRF